jgi:hypothetical protein
MNEIALPKNSKDFPSLENLENIGGVLGLAKL